jgi:MFS family permease
VSGLALALGPVVGGALIGLWTTLFGSAPATVPGLPPGPSPDGWRAIFWFNLVFGLAALIAGMIVLPESSDPDAHRVDISGTVLFAAALTAFTFAIINAENDGFGDPVVIALLILSAVAAAGFFYRESRAAHPLLDLKYLRVPRFRTAIVVAFCAYFATFAVFFFTALYLYEVANETGYKIAITYLPMTVLLILSALLAGRWVTGAREGPAILIGCLLFGAGLLLTTATLNPNPSYVPLALSLALVGVGVGTTVPITSSALSAVPPERSGMAASATNTAREIGAVTGVAILGALVNAQLRSSLTASMNALHIPDTFQSIAIKIIETGGLAGNSGASSVGSSAAGQGALIVEMTHAAYHAFYAGLRAALFLSAFLILAAGLFAFFDVRRRHRPADPA